MAVRTLSQQDFLATYRALLRELVWLFADGSLAFVAGSLSTNPFEAPELPHVVQGDDRWKARFEALMLAAGDARAGWTLQTLDVIREEVEYQRQRQIAQRMHPERFYWRPPQLQQQQEQQRQQQQQEPQRQQQQEQEQQPQQRQDKESRPIWQELEADVPPGARDEHDYLATRQYRVWYGTDREPVLEGADPYFGRGFSEELHLGSCVVHVPTTHRFGELRSSWLRRTFQTVLLDHEDDTLRILELNSLNAEEFVADIHNELNHWQKRSALVFVHGYNVSFRDAALRAAQIGFDLRVDGIMAFFSWPSKGNLLPYLADEARVELAEKHFVSFIELLARHNDVEEINILAHSMGNRLLLRTVERLLSLRMAGALGAPIGNIMLAAADATTALFKQYAGAYTALARDRVTNYTYHADRALMVSRRLHDQERVGLEPPVFVHDGIDTISASNLNLDLLGHGYVATAAPLIYDLAQIIHDNKPPRKRARLEPVPPELCSYWALGR